MPKRRYMRQEKRRKERRVSGHSKYMSLLSDQRQVADRRLKATNKEFVFSDVSFRVCLTGCVVSYILLLSEIIKLWA